MELTKRSSGSAARIVLIVLLVGALFAGGVWFRAWRMSPGVAAGKYLAAWRDGNEDARRDLTTPQSYTLEERLTRIIGRMPRAVSYKVGKAVVDDGRALVHVDGRIRWETGEAAGFGTHVATDMVLVRTDGRWLVDSIGTLANVATELGMPGEMILQQLKAWGSPDVDQSGAEPR